MRKEDLTTETIRMEAAEWVATLHDKVPSSELEARAHEENCIKFLDWLRRSPNHVAAFLRADDTFCRLSGMDPQRRIDIESLHEHYSRHIESPASVSAILAKKSAALRRGYFIACAAAVLIVLSAAVLWIAMAPTGTYTTSVGEQRNVKLPDGSVMTLNTESEARVEFSAGERRILLERGEALFEVEHDERRPFLVLTTSAQVRAIGTRFNVYRREGSAPLQTATTVSVLEGVVQIESVHPDAAKLLTPPAETSEKAAVARDFPVRPPARLSAGEQADISMSGVTRSVAADIADAVAWRERVLVFNGTDLSDVAAEYNRYNTQKIRIRDPEIAHRKMSGTFSADRPQLLVAYLQKDRSISVRGVGAGWIIDKR